MTTLEIVLLLGLAASVAGIGFLLMQRGALMARLWSLEQGRQQAEAEVARAREEARAAGELVTARTAEAAAVSARLEQIERERSASERRDGSMKEEFKNIFGALAGETLRNSTKQLVDMAQERWNTTLKEGQLELEKRKTAVESLVRPIAETLRKTDEKLAAMEQSRTTAYAGLVEQVKSMQGEGLRLREETARLTQALREPHVRGAWGERQLRRVAELAGMTEYCDFATQESTTDAEGNALRPDMVVKLPGGRSVVVDAKTNIQSFLEAIKAETTEAASEAMEKYAGHVERQVVLLSRKKYWAQYEGSPEFVVMFVPGDGFLEAALQRRPDLLEAAWRQNVIPATPSSLIALLRAVAVGYQEQRLAKAAEELRTIGKDLLERAATAYGHILRVGEGLEATVKRYNEFVGSYQQRLEPSLKRMEELGVRSGKELPAVEPVTVTVRGVGEQARLPGA